MCVCLRVRACVLPTPLYMDGDQRAVYGSCFFPSRGQTGVRFQLSELWQALFTFFCWVVPLARVFFFLKQVSCTPNWPQTREIAAARLELLISSSPTFKWRDYRHVPLCIADAQEDLNACEWLGVICNYYRAESWETVLCATVMLARAFLLGMMDPTLLSWHSLHRKANWGLTGCLLSSWALCSILCGAVMKNRFLQSFEGQMTEYIQKCLERYKWPPIGRGSITSDSCGVDLCLIFLLAVSVFFGVHFRAF